MSECKYCGQILVDGQSCNCPEAKAEESRKKKIRDADYRINCLFGPSAVEYGFKELENTDIISILHLAVQQIAESKIHSVAIKIYDGITAKIRIGSNAEIIVERVQTQKKKLE